MIYGLKLLQRGRNSTNDDINTNNNKNTNLNNMDDILIIRIPWVAVIIWIIMSILMMRIIGLSDSKLL